MTLEDRTAPREAGESPLPLDSPSLSDPLTASATVRDPDDTLSQGELTELVKNLERPERSLAVYYAIASMVSGPLFPIFMTASLIRYKTLRYRFDEEGVSVRWGILFRREVSLTYSRIQDIHLASNALERHLGLGKVLVQTASASSGAEIKIEGFKEFEAIRDYLYSRMRGSGAKKSGPVTEESVLSTSRPLATVLNELAVELDELRRTLTERRSRDAERDEGQGP